MKWLDPQSWTDESTFGYEEIKNFANHFREPLAALREWKALRNYVRVNHPHATASQIWKTILCYKHVEYPNMSLLAQIMFCLSGSNSTIERAFSLLMLLLSDRRLRMKHSTMQVVRSITKLVWLPT